MVLKLTEPMEQLKLLEFLLHILIFLIWYMRKETVKLALDLQFIQLLLVLVRLNQRVSGVRIVFKNYVAV